MISYFAFDVMIKLELKCMLLEDLRIPILEIKKKLDEMGASL